MKARFSPAQQFALGVSDTTYEVVDDSDDHLVTLQCPIYGVTFDVYKEDVEFIFSEV